MTPDYNTSDWLTAHHLRAAALTRHHHRTGHIHPTQAARVLDALTQALRNDNQPDNAQAVSKAAQTLRAPTKEAPPPATPNLDRATEALREIAYTHQPVADGARIICRHCTHLWPCDHAAILRGVEDLTRYGDQPPEQPLLVTATKSTLTAELHLPAAAETTEATE